MFFYTVKSSVHWQIRRKDSSLAFFSFVFGSFQADLFGPLRGGGCERTHRTPLPTRLYCSETKHLSFTYNKQIMTYQIICFTVTSPMLYKTVSLVDKHSRNFTYEQLRIHEISLTYNYFAIVSDNLWSEKNKQMYQQLESRSCFPWTNKTISLHACAHRYETLKGLCTTN